MSWLDELQAQGVPSIARRRGHVVSAAGEIAPCPACGAEVRSRGETSGRRDPRPPVRVRSDGAVWHCHAGACKAGGSAVTFALYSLLGVEALPRGDSRWRRLREALGAAPVGPALAHRPSKAPPAPRFPPQAEVATLWRQGAEVFEEADVAEWAARRPGIDLARLDDLDAARVMPEGAPCPDWAQFGKARWSDAGYRILVELIDARGEVRSMRARQLGTRTPKELAPKGHEVAGLVLACPFARRVLAGHDVGDGTPARAHVARTGLLLVEGTPAWLAWLSAFSDASACAPAVVGITTGAWTEAHAAAACSGCTREQPLRVLLDVDADAGGDRIAGQVLRAFRLPMLTGSARLQRRQRIAS